VCVSVSAVLILPAEKHPSVDKRTVMNLSAAEPPASAQTLQREEEHRH